jgi:HK97 gp10 family phage protein
MANELQGVARLTQQLRNLGALENGAKPVVEAAEASAPERQNDDGGALRKTYKGRLVAPGFGKRSVHASVILSRDKQSAAALIGPSKEAHYLTSFVEVGTSHRAPHPWLAPALASNKSQAIAAIADSMRRSLVRIAKKQGGGA